MYKCAWCGKEEEHMQLVYEVARICSMDCAIDYNTFCNTEEEKQKKSQSKRPKNVAKFELK